MIEVPLQWMLVYKQTSIILERELLQGARVSLFSSYTKVYSVIYDSGSVPE